MNTEQAYIEGFVKRAAEYGFSNEEAVNLLKQANRLTKELAKGNLSERAIARLMRPTNSGALAGMRHQIGSPYLKKETFAMNVPGIGLYNDVKGIAPHMDTDLAVALKNNPEKREIYKTMAGDAILAMRKGLKQFPSENTEFIEDEIRSMLTKKDDYRPMLTKK